MTKITHDTIATYAEQRVNLPSASATKYRDQVRHLRKLLQNKIDADPDYGVVKMLHSGSVRKGTALRTTSDMDVAVYVKAAAAPTGSDQALIPWLRARLQEAFPQLRADQFDEQDHCVTLTYASSGLAVDAVPVIYEGEPDNIGYLVNKNTGDRLLTSVSRHIEFIKTRKDKHPDDFAQVVRLAKWWVKEMKRKHGDAFRFKSFMVELILAHLSDRGQKFEDYVAAMEAFFNYILDTELRERIAFTDYYAASELPAASGAVMEIFDPVNPDNNVAQRYTEANRAMIVDATEEAADAIAEAHYSDTKGRAVTLWQIVFGSTFSA
jgi:tRNA nucleotidyltransferase (CCA-adding enzyme)